MGLYIVKVNNLFLARVNDESRYLLTDNPQDYGFEFFEDKKKADKAADKLNGAVISLSEHNEVHR